MKKLLTFLLTALLAFGVGWAETVTTTISSANATGTALSWTNSDLTFSLTQKPSTQNYSVETASPARGLSTGAKTGTHVLTSDQSFSNVTKVEVVASTNASSNTLSVSVGGTSIGNTQTIASGTNNANRTYTFETTSAANGNIVITINDASKTVWIKTITVTYTPGGTPAADNWYRKVTDLSDLVAGKKYIFVKENGASSFGMGAINSNNKYGTPVGISIDNNRVDIGGTGVVEFTLGGSTNAWTFLNPDNRYLGRPSSSSDGLATSETSSGADLKWTIDADGNVMNNQASRYLRCNSSNYFGLLASSGTLAQIYVQDTGGTLVPCGAPVINPDGGRFTGSAVVTITSPTEGATIYYTTDGTDPVVNSRATSTIANGGSVTLTESCTLKALAAKDGMAPSAIVTSQSFTINPSGGSSTTVYEKITSTNDLTDGDYLIVYEDGSFVLDGSLSNLDASDNRFAVTISDNKIETDQNVYFTYDATARTLKSASGYYIGRTASSNGFDFDTETAYQNAISFSSGNAVIAGCNVNGSATTAKLQYWMSGSNGKFRYYTSGQQSIQLYKAISVATPTFSPESGTYTSAQSVTITCATDGATIYYTTDGSTPTTNSTQYTGAITVDQSMTIKAIAVKTGLPNSSVAEAIYTIDLTPTLTASPNPLNINDDNTSGGRTGYFTVTGDNLGTANVGLTRTNNEFTPALEATTGNTYAGEYNGTPYWGFTPAGSLEGKVYMTYNGHALSATTAVNLSNGNNASAAVNVNYLYTGPIYLFGNIGVDADHINNFDFSNGVAMTRNTTDGTYSVNITAVGQNGGSDSWMFFSKNQGDR